jgi:hypothetical protein
MDWPPYWQEATWAMICVAMLHAVLKLCGLLDERAGDDGAVLQHVVEVDEVAVVHVLRVVVCVVEVDDALAWASTTSAGAACAW